MRTTPDEDLRTPICQQDLFKKPKIFWVVLHRQDLFCIAKIFFPKTKISSA